MSAPIQRFTDPTNTIRLIVHDPREREPRAFLWSRDMTVRAAAADAVVAFGYRVADNPGLQQIRDGLTAAVLPADRSLADCGLYDGDTVEIMHTATAV